MAEKTILITIVLMTIVTVIPRVLPFLLFSGRKLPDDVVTWLKYVPVSVLAAMLGPELLWKNSAVNVSFSNFFFWASLPAFAVGVVTRNLFVTVITGMAALALLRAVAG